MDAANALLNQLFSWYVAAFAWAPPLGFAILCIFTGIGTLLVMRRTSDPYKILDAKRRTHAHFLEIQMFDEPRIIWKAQRAFVAANLRYIGLLLPPLVVLAPIYVLLMLRMEAFYGRKPLTVGQEAIVTMTMEKGWDTQAPSLMAPGEIAVETPAVRAVPLNQVTWRIRPMNAFSGALRIQLGDTTIEKRIEAGGIHQRLIPGLRPSSLWRAFLYPDEPRIAMPTVRDIDIAYPETNTWILWFTGISMLTILVLKNRFGVVL